METYRCRVVAVDSVTLEPTVVALAEPCRMCGCHHRHEFRAGEHQAHCGVSGARSYVLELPIGSELARQIAEVTPPLTDRRGRRGRRGGATQLVA